MERIHQRRPAGRGHPPRRDVLRPGGLLLPALAAPALLTGCGTDLASGVGNTLRVSQPGDLKTMDPHKQGDMVSMNALINMFDTLTTRGADNTLRPSGSPCRGPPATRTPGGSGCVPESPSTTASPATRRR